MKLTPDYIEHKTYFSRRIYEDTKRRVQEYEQDTRRELRLNYRQCRTCFYLRNHTVGQAFTEYKCRNCGAAGVHPNTHVPWYCEKCSDAHSVCRDCGARVDGP